MLELILLITPISLLDSTSIIPICMVPLVAILAGRRPALKSAALILSIFFSYWLMGILVLVGLAGVLESISVYLKRFMSTPYPEELLLQCIIGLLLFGFGIKAWLSPVKKANALENKELTTKQAIFTGAGLIIIGFPGAIPYFAAIDVLLRAEITLAEQIFALGMYNVIYTIPLLAIVIIRFVIGTKITPVLNKIKDFMGSWGERVIIGVAIVFGIVLVADAIGWVFDTPLLPVLNAE